MALATLVACGGDDSGGSDTPDGGGGGGGNTGSATLIIGDQTWEFDNFLCAVGEEETDSAMFPFSTQTLTTLDGARVNMRAEIEDPTESGRLSGDGVIYTVALQDIEDFENPSIHFESTSYENEALVEAGLEPPSGGTTITIDGDTVTATGMFDDKLTEDDFTMVAGSLEGNCAP